MVDYDELREQFAGATESEKLSAIRMESVQRMSVIQGYAEIILMLAKERDISDMPDDFPKWCEYIVQNAETMSTVIRALTDSQHQSITEQENATRHRELGEMLWKDAQNGLPELKPYESLRDAIKKLSIETDMQLEISKLRIDDSYLYPGGGIHYSDGKRHVRVGTQKASVGTNYLGYRVAVSFVVDKRNMKSVKFEGITNSLNVVIELLFDWFETGLDIDQLLEKYDWLSKIHVS